MTRSSGKRWLRTLALFLLLLAAARFTDCSPTLFWARRSHLTDLISAMLPPDWGYAPRILAPLLATVQMSVTGTALGVLLALILAPLCAAPYIQILPDCAQKINGCPAHRHKKVRPWRHYFVFTPPIKICSG